MAAGSPLYSFAAKCIQNGEREFKFDSLKGRVVLVVNVASKCGFTPQYTGLEALHQKYSSKGLTILGFPCNQFGSQEPGTDSDIVQFCKTKYDVHFPILEKVEVNGDNVHPLYQWLKEQKSQLLMSRIKWNFEKFLIDKNGNVRERYSSIASPEGLEDEIEKLLKE